MLCTLTQVRLKVGLVSRFFKSYFSPVRWFHLSNDPPPNAAGCDINFKYSPVLRIQHYMPNGAGELI